MTDARFPDRWLMDRRFDRLTDSVFRSYAYALMWSVANQTDGLIEERDLELIRHFNKGDIPVLLQNDLWTVDDYADGDLEIRWRIADFSDTQTSRSDHEVLAKARAAQRNKKRRQRSRAKAQPTQGVTGDGGW